VIVFGDAPAALAGLARDTLPLLDHPAALGVTVATRVPRDRENAAGHGPLVTVQQDGPGTVRSRAVAFVTIRAAIRHATDDDAFDLAQLVFGIFTDPRHAGGPVVRGVTAGLSPFTVPGGEPTTGEALASLTVTAAVRARTLPIP
jgi:hypothetical protein